MNSVTTPRFKDAASTVLFQNVVRAMQAAEELGGPGGAAYVDLMLAVAAEAHARVANFASWNLRDKEEAEVAAGRIADALGTGERGEGLVSVARAAHDAEARLAALERVLPEGLNLEDLVKNAGEYAEFELGAPAVFRPAIAAFTAAGMSYEYPGYLSAALGDSGEVTVGIGNEPAVSESTPDDADFTVQVHDRDGGIVDSAEYAGATAAIAAVNAVRGGGALPEDGRVGKCRTHGIDGHGCEEG